MSKEFLRELMDEFAESRQKRHEDIFGEDDYRAIELSDSDRTKTYLDWLEGVIERAPAIETLPKDKPITYGRNFIIQRGQTFWENPPLDISRFKIYNNDKTVSVNDCYEALDVDFNCKEIRIEGPTLNFHLARSRHTSTSNEKTVVSFNGNEFVVESSHFVKAWLDHDGKGLVFLTNTRSLLSFRAGAFAPYSLGWLPLSFTNLYRSRLSFNPATKEAFFIDGDGMVGVFDSEGFDKALYVPIFPPALWDEIAAKSMESVPQDLRFEKPKPTYSPARNVRKPFSIDSLIRTSRYGSSRQKALMWLKSKGFNFLEEISSKTPQEVGGGNIDFEKHRKHLTQILEAEIVRTTAWDFLGLERDQQTWKAYRLGWPIRRRELEPTLFRASGEVGNEGFIRLSANVRGVRLRVDAVERNEKSELVIKLNGNFILKCDSSLMAKVLDVPYMGNTSSDLFQGSIDLDSYATGPLTAKLLKLYAKVLAGVKISDEELGSVPNWNRGLDNKENRNSAKVHKPAANPLNLVGILRDDPELKHDYTSLGKDYKALRILAMRLSGMTLDEIGEQFDVTRERVRQIVVKHGGADFKKLKLETKAAKNQIQDLESLRIRDFVKSHPGITYEEICAELEIAKDDLLSHLTKFEAKLVSGSRKIWNVEKQWSDEQVMQALRDAQVYFFPLTTSAYEHLVSVGEIKGPSVPLINTRFKSWKQACILAGVEYVESQVTYSVTWTRDELIDILGQYLVDPDTGGSVTEYDSWRNKQPDRMPSTAQLRNVVGGWGTACDEALAKIRSTSWDIKNEL